MSITIEKRKKHKNKTKSRKRGKGRAVAGIVTTSHGFWFFYYIILWINFFVMILCETSDKAEMVYDWANEGAVAEWSHSRAAT